MKGGEVHRHVGAEALDDPARHLVDLLVGVVLAGISSVVSSNQTSVSCFRYSSVSSTGRKAPAADLE